MLQREEKPITILIVDDHAVFRKGLRLMIEQDPRMRVVGEAADPDTALAAARATQPEIVLLDLDLGDQSGFDVLPELLDVGPQLRVILLTGVRDPAEHRRGVLLGAMGLVSKEKSIDTVLKAIEKVHEGEVWLDRTLIAQVLNYRVRENTSQQYNAEQAKIATLTEREREVIKLIGEGLRNQQIAERLTISEATVRNHLTSIFSKLGVADRFELVVYAYKHELAGVPQ
jgi:RNA polymerase sigma factor (sigma-70 family)